MKRWRCKLNTHSIRYSKISNPQIKCDNTPVVNMVPDNRARDELTQVMSFLWHSGLVGHKNYGGRVISSNCICRFITWSLQYGQRFAFWVKLKYYFLLKTLHSAMCFSNPEMSDLLYSDLYLSRDFHLKRVFTFVSWQMGGISVHFLESCDT